uniref:Uncharacterized protein n=1 Tax=Ditylenchus dipsaci TaxID=166011 RepID=A0A915EN23_9BILA
MAMERAIGLIGRHLVTSKHFTILSLIFTIASMCFASPAFLPNFYTHVYRFRYLCAIGSKSPIIYSLIQILIYGGCLFVLLVCFGSLLTYRIDTRSLPNKPQDYSSFIMESRALQDHLVLGRLVLFMTLAYLFIEGPYICMSFFVQIRNSGELLAQYDGVEFEFPQELDTTITYLRFFFPLITPLLILGNCHDIWTKFMNLICCRRNTNHMFGAWGQLAGHKGSSMVNPDNVLTLVATADGLQLRVPTNYNQMIQDNSYKQFQNQIKEDQRQQLQRENLPAEETFEPEFDSRSKIVEFERVKQESHLPNTAESQLKSKMYGKQENVVVHNKTSTIISKLRKPKAGRSNAKNVK